MTAVFGDAWFRRRKLRYEHFEFESQLALEVMRNNHRSHKRTGVHVCAFITLTKMAVFRVRQYALQLTQPPPRSYVFHTTKTADIFGS